jgi:general secretion pathway protein G
MQRYSEKTALIYRSGGFTLIEIMIVLFILLALVAAMVGAYQGRMNKANYQTTLLYVQTLATQLDMYQVDIGHFPTTEQGLNALLDAPSDLANPAKWAGPYLKDNAKTNDPWNNPYQYCCPGVRSRSGYDVWSLGPDQTDGTEDDIGNWTKE